MNTNYFILVIILSLTCQRNFAHHYVNINPCSFNNKKSLKCQFKYTTSGRLADKSYFAVNVCRLLWEKVVTDKLACDFIIHPNNSRLSYILCYYFTILILFEMLGGI